MLEPEDITKLFGELDEILNRQVLKLVQEAPLIRIYFMEIVERVVSGSTLGKNYYDKQDREDGKAKAKKTTILQPSEVRILKKAFWLLRAIDNPKTFGRLVLEISFLRGIMEEAVELFLKTISEYKELHVKLQKAKIEQSLEYLNYDRRIQEIHDHLEMHDPEKIIRLIDAIEADWDLYVDTRSKILKPYLRMVFSWANDFSSSETQTLDNFQSGVFGLVRAVRNYTPSRFAHFSVVAEQWVRQSILQYLKTDVNFIRLPMANWHFLQKIDKAKAKLEQRLNRKPSVEEIAQETELAVQKVKKIMENALLVKVYSLDAPTNNEEDQENEGSWNRDSIHQSDETPEHHILKDSEIEVIRHVIQLFDDEEKIIFGLVSGCYEVIPDPMFTEEEILKEKLRQRAAQYNLEISFKSNG